MKIKGRGPATKTAKSAPKENSPKVEIGSQTHRATSVLQLVLTDPPESTEPVDLNGNRYVISFTDNLSGAVYVYFNKNKGDAVLATERFIADSSPCGKIKTLD